jgi:5-methylthioribose kinase
LARITEVFFGNPGPGLSIYLPVERVFMETQQQLTEASLPDYLRSIGLVGPTEEVAVEKAGDGNINWVRRARASCPTELHAGVRSWIVKQARLALERFPEYQVSTERIVFEHRYYEAVARHDLDAVCPRIHAFDAEARVLVLEDLGGAERLDRALARRADVTGPIAKLARFLGRVHAATRESPPAESFGNDEMRRLHGDHIFELPLRPNEFPLEPAVAERAAALREDADFVALADAAYLRYLEPRGALVHGDVQAGNILLAASGPKLLDAEISHVGDPAFDVGTLVAHVMLPAAAAGAAERASPQVASLWREYASAQGPSHLPAFRDVARYAGLELMRRTIGAARVEAALETAGALAVLETAEVWVRTPPESF